MKRLIRFLPIVLVVIAFAAAVWGQRNLSGQLAVHWDASGAVNGYGSKFEGVWLLPIIMAVMLPLFFILVRIDPKYRNIQKFEMPWYGFMTVLEGLMLYLYLLTLAWNNGRTFDFDQAMAFGFAWLALGMAWLVSNAKQNYTIGIRTPWTLASERVWDGTHAMAAKLYLAAAAAAVAGFVWPAAAFWLAVGGLVGASLTAVVYSYILFRREH